MLDHNFSAYLPYDLLIKTDRTSMAVSLEARCPLLDTRLVEFCSQRVPDRARIQGLTTKWLFRRAFADMIPPEIMTRKKSGFGIPLATWTRGPLRAYMTELLQGPGCRLNTYLDQRRVRRYFDDHMSGRADHGHQLWLLLTLEVWLRQLPGLAARTTAPPLAA
jgi:asparagine synthase (glutamine-hydrolysing)